MIGLSREKLSNYDLQNEQKLIYRLLTFIRLIYGHLTI